MNLRNEEVRSSAVDGEDDGRREVLASFATMVGLLVGACHLWLSARALFVFREGEGAAAWVAVLCGPLTTLPSVVTTFFLGRIGALWIVASGIVSLLALLISGAGPSDTAGFFVVVTAPMLMIGVTLAKLSGTRGRTISRTSSPPNASRR